MKGKISRGSFRSFGFIQFCYQFFFTVKSRKAGIFTANFQQVSALQNETVRKFASPLNSSLAWVASSSVETLNSIEFLSTFNKPKNPTFNSWPSSTSSDHRKPFRRIIYCLQQISIFLTENASFFILFCRKFLSKRQYFCFSFQIIVFQVKSFANNSHFKLFMQLHEKLLLLLLVKLDCVRNSCLRLAKAPNF